MLYWMTRDAVLAMIITSDLLNFFKVILCSYHDYNCTYNCSHSDYIVRQVMLKDTKRTNDFSSVRYFKFFSVTP